MFEELRKDLRKDMDKRSDDQERHFDELREEIKSCGDGAHVAVGVGARDTPPMAN